MSSIIALIRRIGLTRWIFIALAAGFVFGVLYPVPDPNLPKVPLAWWEIRPTDLKPLRALFLNGVKCIIAPLIFATIVSGIAGAGSFKRVGVMGARALLYFEVVTTVALFYGLAAVNLFRPGDGLKIGGAIPEGAKAAADTHMTIGGFIEHLLPHNIAEAIVKGDVLQIVIFSTLFGFGVLSVGPKALPVLRFCEGLAEVMFRFTGYIMLLAPVGVGAAMAVSVSEHGWQVIIPMLKLVGTLYVALIAFVVSVFLPVCWIFRISPLGLARAIKDAVILAFATTSSESAYPLAMASLERFGVPRRISSFVLPMGYSFNLDGSTLYLGIAVIFIAQAAGIEEPIGRQLAMMATLMLTTKGVAAVPRASMVVLSATLTGFNLPLEGLALIMAVDEFMDMGRTAVNLLGNCLATAVVARWEGVKLGQGPAEETIEVVAAEG